MKRRELISLIVEASLGNKESNAQKPSSATEDKALLERLEKMENLGYTSYQQEQEIFSNLYILYHLPHEDKNPDQLFLIFDYRYHLNDSGDQKWPDQQLTKAKSNQEVARLLGTYYPFLGYILYRYYYNPDHGAEDDTLFINSRSKLLSTLLSGTKIDTTNLEILLRYEKHTQNAPEQEKLCSKIAELLFSDNGTEAAALGVFQLYPYFKENNSAKELIWQAVKYIFQHSPQSTQHIVQIANNIIFTLPESNEKTQALEILSEVFKSYPEKALDYEYYYKVPNADIYFKNALKTLEQTSPRRTRYILTNAGNPRLPPGMELGKILEEIDQIIKMTNK